MAASYQNVNATLLTLLSNGEQPCTITPGVAPSANLVADLAAADTAFDTFAAAVIAITSDTYNTTTDQFTFGGATGLTHAQWATVGALLNTAMVSYVAAKADTAGVGVADVQLTFDKTNVPTATRLRRALEAIMRAVDGGLGGLTP